MLKDIKENMNMMRREIDNIKTTKILETKHVLLVK